MPIELSRQRREELIASVRRYFIEKLEAEAPTDLELRFLIEFFLQELGPSIYNQAVQDVQSVLGERVAEVDSVCFEAEQDYWSTAERRRRGDGEINRP